MTPHLPDLPDLPRPTSPSTGRQLLQHDRHPDRQLAEAVTPRPRPPLRAARDDAEGAADGERGGRRQGDHVVRSDAARRLHRRAARLLGGADAGEPQAAPGAFGSRPNTFADLTPHDPPHVSHPTSLAPLRQVHRKMGEQVCTLMETSLLRKKSAWEEQIKKLRAQVERAALHTPPCTHLHSRLHSHLHSHLRSHLDRARRSRSCSLGTRG